MDICIVSINIRYVRLVNRLIMSELYVVKQVHAGLIEEPRMKSLHGKWGFYAVNGSQVYPLEVWPWEGEPTKEWIEDCREYHFGDG
jgi:hypothetical protein